MSATSTPPGWFADPSGASSLRWWDGHQWTSATAPLPQNGSSPPVAASPAGIPDSAPRHSGLFGSKRQLEEENAALRQTLESLGQPERDRLAAELQELRRDIPALRNERESLRSQVEPLRGELAELSSARAERATLAASIDAARKQQKDYQEQLNHYNHLVSQRQQLEARIAELRSQVIETEETAILQEVGLYRYRHPLDNAVAYKAKLTRIQAEIKDCVRAGNAVQGSTSWTVNGSAREGSKMVRELSKLMLRAYNAEAESAVRYLKPYALDSAVSRLNKARDAIVKLGGTMRIRVGDRYHALRIYELELTADYQAKVAEEKERERIQRAHQREEEKVRREIEREQERLRKEQQHYATVLATYKAQEDAAAVATAERKLQEISDGLDGLNRRAANIRAGYVYVISNVGAFGPNVVKVGLTRRLEPMDRIRELGDASVPFRYDVHLLAFNDDAVGLETHLHHALADRKVNEVNARREFFYATPAEVRELLTTLDVSLLSYVEEPEALEWRQSETIRREMSSNRAT